MPTECGSCGAEMEFVPILTDRGARKHHPIDYPRRRTPWGRVYYDESIGAWRILDARLITLKDNTIGPRAGIEWPRDGGAYMSHMDTCHDVYARRVRERRRTARTEEEHAAALLEDADAHIPRCALCGARMDEELAADDRIGNPVIGYRRRPWRVCPSCDPEHRRPSVAEANRLTGRRDLRAADVAVPVEILIAAQHEHVAHLAEAERANLPDWRQGVLTLGAGP